MAKIERSNSTGRFTAEQLAAKTRESRAFWASPEGKAQQVKLDRESRARTAKPAGVKFPTVAKKAKLAPGITGPDEALISRFI